MARQRTLYEILETHELGLKQVQLALARVSGGSGLGDLDDVTITAVGTGEVLLYTGAGWENQTLAEAGIAAAADYLPLAGGTMTGAILADGAGDATAPAIAFDSDPDTGMYLDSANVLAIATQGVERIRVQADGTVVIGTQTDGRARIHAASADPSSPTYAFYGDGNTGMYRPADETIAFATGGLEVARFSNPSAQRMMSFEGGPTFLAFTDGGGNDNGILFEGSTAATALRQITYNDGGGNWNFRAGNHWDGANDVFTTTGASALWLRGSHDTATGLWEMRVADGTGHTAGDTITWDSEFQLGSTSAILDVPLTVANGTAGAPGINFVGDGDSGMRLNGTAVLSFVTASTDRFTISTDRLDGQGGTGSPSIRYTSGGAESPTYSFTGDTDIGVYRVGTNEMGFAANATAQFQLGDGYFRSADSAAGNPYLRSAAGTAAAPDRTYRSDLDTGTFRAGANRWGVSAGGQQYLEVNASWGSGVGIGENLTDIGNHEVLRADRTASGTAVTEVGYYSSWAHLKHDIRPVADDMRWRREWFMDLEPVGYERNENGASLKRKAGDPDYRQIELGFTIDNLIEHTNLLTTKGNRVGDAPDEFAILSVTVDYVQHLARRVEQLEARLA